MTETETSSRTEQLKQLDAFIKQRDQYLANAEEAASRQEYRKSSELLWGSLTQSIKALAFSANASISNHEQFFTFMEQLAKEARELSLYENFVTLNDLHRNFYDEFIPYNAFPL